MTRWKAFIVTTVLLGFCPTLFAQPTVQELQKDVEELRRSLREQREAFEARIKELEGEVQETLGIELEKQIDEIVANKSMFYARPASGAREPQYLFNSLKGGLIFSGLFRTRFEYRRANIDFNGGSGGIDDEGVRFNGRFRLGFGAVLLESQGGSKTDPQISVLTEFQSVGDFANNSYANIPGPGGAPLPTQFNILTEPFEDVELYLGYLYFERILGEHISFKLGRQEITFGSEFLMGNNSFFDGTVHDGALVEWKEEGLEVSLFYAKEAASDKNLVTGISDFDEDELAGVYVSWTAREDLTLEGYVLYFNARSVDTDLFVTGSNAFFLDGAMNPAILGSFWTFGARVFWTDIDFLGGKLALNAEAAYQTGNRNLHSPPSSVADQSIHGWGAEFIANWWMFGEEAEGLLPILTLAYYYAGGGSANDVDATGRPLTHIGFQPLFVNRHFDVRDRLDRTQPYFPGGGRYGNMDIIPLSNVHLAKVALTIGPSEKTEVGVGYILAVTADDEGYGTGIYGHEVDLFGTYQYNDYVQFSASLSVFFPEDTATDLSNLLFFAPGEEDAGDDPALAFYIQALISF